jgi:Zn-dependent metalloprotease
MLRVGFGSQAPEFKSVFSQSYRDLVAVPQLSKNPIAGTGCRCFIIPPHMQKNITDASQEQIQDRLEIQAEHEQRVKNHQHSDDTRAQRKATVIQKDHAHREQHHQSLFHKEEHIPATLVQHVYNAKHKEIEKLPRKEVESPGTSTDVAVREAFKGGANCHKYFALCFGRNSVDDKGMPLISVVHYGKDFENAFWANGRMSYGDGSRFFNRFTIDGTVITHEEGHGVTEHTCGLDYEGQSGATNEHLSDVHGICNEMHDLNQTVETGAWVIGSKLFKSDKGEALRSFKAPGTAYNDEVLGKDPQPDHMANYVVTKEDDGGVHLNSGILNRAFYETSNELGVWGKPMKIWYATQTDPSLQPKASFEEFAALTIKNAIKLNGKDSKEAGAVVKAWTTVGVLK